LLDGVANAIFGVVSILVVPDEDRDRDNALAVWPEHGLHGTQLGPNKNGKKW
jgi:hypothetical protein